MSECEKNKAGLQKKVSSVFKGVPLPQGSAGRQTSGTPAPDPIAGVCAKSMPPDRQPQSSLMRKLHQSEETPGNAIPGGTAEIGPEPVPPARRMQHPAAKGIHEPETPKKAAPAKQLKAAPASQTSGPGLWRRINDKLFASKPGVSPTRQKAMVVLVPILAIVMIFVFRQVLSTPPHKTHGATEDETLPAVRAQSGHEIDWRVPDPLPATMRDPAKLADQTPTNDAEPHGTAAGPKTAAIDVRDIIYSEDKPSAFINGRIVYVGSKIGEVTILRINRDSIEFERDGNRWVQKIRD